MDFKEQGLAIRGARLAKRMTQAHLAGLSGVSEKTVRRAEAGERLQADSIRALCAALDLDASELRMEHELVPDLEAAVSTALSGQAARVRAYVRTVVLTSILFAVAALFRDDPVANEILAWGGALLLLAWFTNILAMVFSAAFYRRSEATRRFVDRRRGLMLLVNGFILSAFLPAMVWLDASGIAEAIRQPGPATLAYLTVDLFVTWWLVNMATNEILTLQGDAQARVLDPLSGALRSRLAAMAKRVVRRWAEVAPDGRRVATDDARS